MIRTTSQTGLGHSSAPALDALRTLRVPTQRLLRSLGSRPSVLALLLATLTVALAAGTGAATVVENHLFEVSIQPAAHAPSAPPRYLTAPRRIVASIGKLNPLSGLASWYGDMWNGRKTASGETFDETKMTAAHKSLPLGTIVRVTNLDSKRSVVVKINDRGTLAPHRIIDLSSAAAREIGMIDNGLAKVKLEILGRT